MSNEGLRGGSEVGDDSEAIKSEYLLSSESISDYSKFLRQKLGN